MAMLIADPKIILLAFLGGIIPSLLWLKFWLREEENPEPNGLLAAVFIMGMFVVILVLPIQKFVQDHVNGVNLDLVLWASIEEIFKYLAVLIIVYHTHDVDDPIDWPIYMITAALGFAALENTMFLIKPFSVSQNTLALLTGNLRFLGSTLLHTVSSGILGIALGMSIHGGFFKRKFFLITGLLVAITLHSVFNFFIMRNDGNDFLKVFGFLWVVTVIIMLLFEKVRRMSENY